MKYIQWGLLFCCCDVLLASNIDKSIDLVNDFNREGEASSLTNAQECALSLCGSPENQKKYYITDENFDKLVAPEDIKKFSQIEHKIEDIIDQLIGEARSVIEALKKFTTGEGDNFRDWSRFRDWSGDEYNRMAQYVYTPYMVIKVSSNPINLAANPPADADEDFLKGLNSFATNSQMILQEDGDVFFRWNCDYVCAMGIQSYWSKERIKRMVEGAEAELNKPSFASFSMASCKSHFGMLSEKDTREKIALRMVHNAKARILERVNKSFSSRTYQFFKKHLNERVKFAWDHRSFGQSPEFQDFLDSINKRHGGLSENLTIFYKEDFYTLAWFMVGLLWRGETETARTSIDLCPDIFTSKLLFTDSFYSNRFGFLGPLVPDAFAIEKIRVSPASLVDPEHGEAIVAHEIAHTLSHAFKLGKLSGKSKRKYLGLRKCATSAYLNKSNRIFHPFRYRGDGTYTEEDVADIIVWSSYPKGGKVNYCSALNTDKSFSNYTGLSMFNPEPEPTHSSIFLRVIMEAVYKDIPLPSSCKKFLHAHRDFYKVKKCSVE